ncbi:MAG TPA: glycosyltransferase family 4 protein [Nitrospirota bacterium]|nr:glycosyltransferase family 4 protein [Nitrospirota bacterium]
MKTAIVHDWLISYAGSERVLEQIIKLYPDADLFSLIDFLPEPERQFLQHRNIQTSFLQHFPFAKSKYRGYLPFMPLAIEQFDLSSYELVISSSHAVAKGVLTTSDQLHVCYCHTPIRYAWDLQRQYLIESGLDKGIKGKIAKLILHYIRLWDYSASRRVDHFIANSHNVAAKIKKHYGREASVIYPPVDIDKFQPISKKEDFFLTVSRMVPYKKIDLIVEAFSQTPDKRLVVIGDGPTLSKVKAKAKKNIEILGYQVTDVIRSYLQRARAFVFAADEDFGILPVEAQACGTPVIAYEKGGVLETIINGKTGIFFKEQTTASLINAVQEFERSEDCFDTNVIRQNAEKYGRDRFQKEFLDLMGKIVVAR